LEANSGRIFDEDFILRSLNIFGCKMAVHIDFFTCHLSHEEKSANYQWFHSQMRKVTNYKAENPEDNDTETTNITRHFQ